jgi:hypothetical protein
VGDSRFHVACSVGRLVEVRPEKLTTVEDVRAQSAAVGKLMRELGSEAIFCVDWRRLRVLAPDVATALSDAMRTSNTMTVRSAALINAHATFAMQAERIIREANNPMRRVFRDAQEMLAWLGELMTPREAERARGFLASASDAPPSEVTSSHPFRARARPGS